jgi:hypothetical protein
MRAQPTLAQNADLHQKLDDKNRELASRHILLLKVRENCRVQSVPKALGSLYQSSWRHSFQFARALALIQARNALEELEASSAENERRAESEAASLAGAHFHAAAIQT